MISCSAMETLTYCFTFKRDCDNVEKSHSRANTRVHQCGGLEQSCPVSLKSSVISYENAQNAISKNDGPCHMVRTVRRYSHQSCDTLPPLQVNARSDPPVCKLVDYKKFKFEAKKKEKDRKKQEVGYQDLEPQHWVFCGSEQWKGFEVSGKLGYASTPGCV